MVGRLALLLICLALPLRAEGERPGFDYWVMALSWQPSWCAGDGAGRDACETPRGFTLHGLWPQYETGWPSWCSRETRDPTRAETAAVADLFGSAGSAWYQWRKHGRCAGMDPGDYFDTAREAFGGVLRPELLRRLGRTVRIAPGVVEAAFLEGNPEIEADMLTITCRDGRIAEARLCLTKDLEPRVCGADVIRDCGAESALLPAVGQDATGVD